MTTIAQQVEGLGTRFFGTREEAEQHKPADKPEWKLFCYDGPNNEQVWGYTGGAAVLGWQVCVAFGWRATEANKVAARQMSAEELLAAMPEEARLALLAKFLK